MTSKTFDNSQIETNFYEFYHGYVHMSCSTIDVIPVAHIHLRGCCTFLYQILAKEPWRSQRPLFEPMIAFYEYISYGTCEYIAQYRVKKST